MHEMSIARSLVRVAEEGAMEEGASLVTALYLRLGDGAGVVREALEFAFEYATAGTLLEGARLVIEPVAMAVHCDACGAQGPPVSTTRLRCRRCDAPTPNITAGKELLVRAIDFDRAPAAAERQATSPSRVQP